MHFFRLGESQINLHGRLPPTIGTEMFVLYEDDYADLHDLVTAACAPLPAERPRVQSVRKVSTDSSFAPHRRMGSDSFGSSLGGGMRTRSNSSTGTFVRTRSGSASGGGEWKGVLAALVEVASERERACRCLCFSLLFSSLLFSSLLFSSLLLSSFLLSSLFAHRLISMPPRPRTHSATLPSVLPWIWNERLGAQVNPANGRARELEYISPNALLLHCDAPHAHAGDGRVRGAG